MHELDLQPEFPTRHIGPDKDEIAEMLSSIGYANFEELCDAAIPSGIRKSEPLNLPDPISEEDALAKIQRIASLNQPLRSPVSYTHLRAHET